MAVVRQSELEERLEYTLVKMEGTLRRAEVLMGELKPLENVEESSDWLKKYCQVADALVRHVTGEVRGASTEEFFRYPDRLVRSDYYKSDTLYSGEAEDDAAECLRRLKKKRKFEMRFDSLNDRRQCVHDALKHAERQVADMGFVLKRDFPAESLTRAGRLVAARSTQGRHSFVEPRDECTRRLKKKKRPLRDENTSVEALKRATGVEPKKLEAASELLRAEEKVSSSHGGGDDDGEGVFRQNSGDRDEKEGEELDRAEKEGRIEDALKRARSRLRRALDEEFSVEDVAHRRRTLGRCLRLSKKYRDAEDVLTAALRCRGISKVELERCFVDRGLCFLDAGTRYDAARALRDFEECKRLSRAQDDDPLWRDAHARALFNCGLARLAMDTSVDSEAALIEFRSALVLFTQIQSDPLPTEDATLASQLIDEIQGYLSTDQQKPLVGAASTVGRPCSISEKKRVIPRKIQQTAHITVEDTWPHDECFDDPYFYHHQDPTLKNEKTTVVRGDCREIELTGTTILCCRDCVNLNATKMPTTLTKLGLRRCGLTLNCLADVPELPSLRWLDVSSNPLTLDLSRPGGLKRLLHNVHEADVADCCPDGSVAVSRELLLPRISSNLSLAANVFTVQEWIRLFNTLRPASLDLRYCANYGDTSIAFAEAFYAAVASIGRVRLAYVENFLNIKPSTRRFAHQLHLDLRGVADQPLASMLCLDDGLLSLDISESSFSLPSLSTRLVALNLSSCPINVATLLSILNRCQSLNFLDASHTHFPDDSSSSNQDISSFEPFLRLDYFDLSASRGFFQTPLQADDFIQAWERCSSRRFVQGAYATDLFRLRTSSPSSSSPSASLF